MFSQQTDLQQVSRLWINIILITASLTRSVCCSFILDDTYSFTLASAAALSLYPRLLLQRLNTPRLDAKALIILCSHCTRATQVCSPSNDERNLPKNGQTVTDEQNGSPTEDKRRLGSAYLR